MLEIPNSVVATSRFDSTLQDLKKLQSTSLAARGTNDSIFKFVYSTIYPHNLNSKILTIKCYKKNLFGHSTLLTAFNKLTLHMLATGPSKYEINLTDSTNAIGKLSFVCEFIQLCPSFTIKVVRPSDKMMCVVNDETKDSQTFDGEIKLSGSVTELENYSVSKSDDTEQKNKTLEWLRSKTSGQSRQLNEHFSWIISEGPLYHQMSKDSLANENGVVHGRVVLNYPTPLKYAHGRVILGIYSPFLTKIFPVTGSGEIETLIRIYYQQKINKVLAQRLLKIRRR